MTRTLKQLAKVLLILAVLFSTLNINILDTMAYNHGDKWEDSNYEYMYVANQSSPNYNSGGYTGTLSASVDYSGYPQTVTDRGTKYIGTATWGLYVSDAGTSYMRWHQYYEKYVSPTRPDMNIYDLWMENEYEGNSYSIPSNIQAEAQAAFIAERSKHYTECNASVSDGNSCSELSSGSLKVFTYTNEYRKKSGLVTTYSGTVRKAKPKMNCPADTESVGSGSTAYCLKKNKTTKYVKQTETKYVAPNSNIDLSEFGSEKGEANGDFEGDKKEHSNQWHGDEKGKYKSNHIIYTNIPDTGFINANGDGWSPHVMINQKDTKLPIPRVQNGSDVVLTEQDWNKLLEQYKTNGGSSELLIYKVTDMATLKDIEKSSEGLESLYLKNGVEYKHKNNITSMTVDSTGVKGFDNFKITKSGNYILASKYVDILNAKKEMSNPNQQVLAKHTYYGFSNVEVNFLADLGYLPIYNNLASKINDTIFISNNKKVNHKLPNLEYGSYKSLKVPSAYNHNSGKTLIGSTTGGLTLLNDKLTLETIQADSSLMSGLKVSNVIEHKGGFYISTDKGIYYLNSKDNTLNPTSIIEAVNDMKLNNDNLYYITDKHLNMAFTGEGDLITTNVKYDLSQEFSDPTILAGSIEIVGDLINITSKTEGSLPEVVTLSK